MPHVGIDASGGGVGQRKRERAKENVEGRRESDETGRQTEAARGWVEGGAHGIIGATFKTLNTILCHTYGVVINLIGGGLMVFVVPPRRTTNTVFRV